MNITQSQQSIYVIVFFFIQDKQFSENLSEDWSDVSESHTNDIMESNTANTDSQLFCHHFLNTIWAVSREKYLRTCAKCTD